jgi:hypothetical protein
MPIPPVVLRADAREMYATMRDAECIKRHFVISLDKLAEILTALCTDGDIAARNSKGYDVHSQAFGKIEVKSRLLGTDGRFPRISLSPNKMTGADSFIAVRWTAQFELYSAIMLSRAAVQPLFETRLQTSGKTAHISWSQWLAAKGAIDFTSRFLDVLRYEANPGNV